MIKKLAVLIVSTLILTACGGKPAPVEETQTEVQEDAASEDAASEDTASDNATSKTADEGTDLSDAQSTVTDVEGRAMLCEVTLNKDGTEVETLREVKFK